MPVVTELIGSDPGCPLNAGGELQGIPHRRPPSLMPVRGQPSSQLRRVGRPASSRPRRKTHNAGRRACMPSREIFRAVEQIAGVHKASMGIRNGYSSVIFLRRPIIIERPAAVLRAPKIIVDGFSGRSCFEPACRNLRSGVDA